MNEIMKNMDAGLKMEDPEGAYILAVVDSYLKLGMLHEALRWEWVELAHQGGAR